MADEMAVPGSADAAVAEGAGWHPDPFGRAPYRYWDGVRWTGFAGDGTAVTWDAAPVEPPRPGSAGFPGVGTALLGTVIGFALAFGISLVLDAADDPGGRPALLGLSELGLWAGLLGACVLVSRRRGTRSLSRDFDLRFRWSDLGFGLAGSLVGRMVAGAALAPIPFPTRSLHDVDRSVLHDGTHGAAAWTVLVLVTCVGAPLVEELFFRGLLQTRLVTRLGPVLGIVVTSLLFGAAHLVAWNGPTTLAYGWSIAATGLVLGTMRYASGRLGTSILAHALFNAQALLALAFLS